MRAVPDHATLYDFRDLDLMIQIADWEEGIDSRDLADTLGFGENARPVGIRLAWMRRYGMVDLDPRNRLWSLTGGGERVLEARLRAAQTRTLEAIPDEALIDVMAHVTSRYQLGDPMMAAMLRREFLFGTKRR